MKYEQSKLLIFLSTFLCFFACTKDNMTTPPISIDCSNIMASYVNDIQPIMNSSCAISGCHISGFGSGDFTTYSGLKAKVDDGTVKNRTIVNMNMPPANSSGPTTLTMTQIDLLNCWIEAGAPEN